MKKLTKTQRQEVHDRYGGKCGYCGNLLGKSWGSPGAATTSSP